MFMYLSEVQKHPCRWISDYRETRMERRGSTVEQRVNVYISLSHPGEDDSNCYMCSR